MSTMSLNKLVFDPSNMADSANVGAYLRGNDGTLITHTSGKLDVQIGNTSIAVTASDLDIRNLVFADDKVDVSGSEVALDSATLAALESITVQNGAGAAAVNIQDGGNSITVDGTVGTTPGGGTTAAYGAVSVGNTATDLIGTDLSGRFEVMLQNLGSKDVYIGANNSVTTANGILLAAGATIVLNAAAAVNVHGITSSGTSSVRYFELAV